MRAELAKPSSGSLPVAHVVIDHPGGIKGKEQVLKILEAQLQATRGKLLEMQAFERDLVANIARMKALLDEARQQA